MDRDGAEHHDESCFSVSYSEPNGADEATVRGNRGWGDYGAPGECAAKTAQWIQRRISNRFLIITADGPHSSVRDARLPSTLTAPDDDTFLINPRRFKDGSGKAQNAGEWRQKNWPHKVLAGLEEGGIEVCGAGFAMTKAGFERLRVKVKDPEKLLVWAAMKKLYCERESAADTPIARLTVRRADPLTPYLNELRYAKNFIHRTFKDRIKRWERAFDENNEIVWTAFLSHPLSHGEDMTFKGPGLKVDWCNIAPVTTVESLRLCMSGAAEKQSELDEKTTVRDTHFERRRDVAAADRTTVHEISKVSGELDRQIEEHDAEVLRMISKRATHWANTGCTEALAEAVTAHAVRRSRREYLWQLLEHPESTSFQTHCDNLRKRLATPMSYIEGLEDTRPKEWLRRVLAGEHQVDPGEEPPQEELARLQALEALPATTPTQPAKPQDVSVLPQQELNGGDRRRPPQPHPALDGAPLAEYPPLPASRSTPTATKTSAPTSADQSSQTRSDTEEVLTQGMRHYGHIPTPDTAPPLRAPSSERFNSAGEYYSPSVSVQVPATSPRTTLKSGRSNGRSAAAKLGDAIAIAGSEICDAINERAQAADPNDEMANYLRTTNAASNPATTTAPTSSVEAAPTPGPAHEATTARGRSATRRDPNGRSTGRSRSRAASKRPPEGDRPNSEQPGKRHTSAGPTTRNNEATAAAAANAPTSQLEKAHSADHAGKGSEKG